MSYFVLGCEGLSCGGGHGERRKFPCVERVLFLCVILINSMAIFGAHTANAETLSCGRELLGPSELFIEPELGIWIESGEGRRELVVSDGDASLRRLSDWKSLDHQYPGRGWPAALKVANSHNTAYEGDTAYLEWNAVVVEQDDGGYFEKNPDRILRMKVEDGVPIFKELVIDTDTNKFGVDERFKILEIYEWIPVEDGFLMFADFSEASLESRRIRYRSGFVFVKPDAVAEEQFIVVREITDFRDPAVYQYIRTSSYIAGPFPSEDQGEQIAVILLLDKRPSLLKFSTQAPGTPVQLVEFPAEYQVRPELRAQMGVPVGGLNEVNQLRQFETSKMAYSIHGFGADAYLLAKESIVYETDDPNAAGMTEWRLFKIDPSTGAEKGVSPVLSTSARLRAIPGSTWAFLEMLPIKEAGKLGGKTIPFKRVPSVLYMPSQWIAIGSDAIPVDLRRGDRSC